MTDHIVLSPARPRERVRINYIGIGVAVGRAIGGLIFGIISHVFEQDTAHPNYHGNLGTDTGGKRYDQMTKAEHDEAGRWWNP